MAKGRPGHWTQSAGSELKEIVLLEQFLLAVFVVSPHKIVSYTKGEKAFYSKRSSRMS